MRGDWMQTYTGRKFYILDPRPEDVDVVDIAHHLSLIDRFTGATERGISVAQHSVWVSCRFSSVEPLLALWGLLHDAAEAYTGDVGRPLKRCLKELGLDFDRAVEAPILTCIAEALQIPPCPNWGAVKYADEEALAAEARSCMHSIHPEWDLPESDVVVQPWSPRVAEESFLARYRLLRC